MPGSFPFALSEFEEFEEVLRAGVLTGGDEPLGSALVGDTVGLPLPCDLEIMFQRFHTIFTEDMTRYIHRGAWKHTGDHFRVFRNHNFLHSDVMFFLFLPPTQQMSES